ncbi:MAG: hypothetical protein HY675_10730 [Chloroflexi bacterium]|nr:hypothetical protein [Chloroflexota bacterium]
MTKVERVEAALQGQQVDRAPVSFWGHSYLKEWTPEGLAEAMLAFHRKYDWDFMKVNPRASYHAEDWGAVYKASGEPHRGPSFVDSPIKNAGDWTKLDLLDPEKGVLGEHLKALRLIKEGLADDAPFIQTIFSPLSIAKYIVGNKPEVILAHLREDANSLSYGLSVIARTFVDYARCCLDAGASGIFFATTGWASADLLSEDDYVVYGQRYDLEVLEAVRDIGSFNVLHNCGDNIFFELLSYYPVHAINWATTAPGNPSLRNALTLTDKAVMGGVREKTTLRQGHPAEVAAEARDALQQTGGQRFLLTGGCSIPTDVPEPNLRAARAAIL